MRPRLQRPPGGERGRRRQRGQRHPRGGVPRRPGRRPPDLDARCPALCTPLLPFFPILTAPAPAPESRIEPRPAQQLLLVWLPRLLSWCSAGSPPRSQCLWVGREAPLSRSSSSSSSSCCHRRCLVLAHPDTPASRASG